MPGMSGPMLIDHLLLTMPNLRVLFMSGYDDRQVVQKYVVEKGFALIPKPFTLQKLAATVRDVLAQNVLDGSPQPEPVPPAI